MWTSSRARTQITIFALAALLACCTSRFPTWLHQPVIWVYKEHSICVEKLLIAGYHLTLERLEKVVSLEDTLAFHMILMDVSKDHLRLAAMKDAESL